MGLLIRQGPGFVHTVVRRLPVHRHRRRSHPILSASRGGDTNSDTNVAPLADHYPHSVIIPKMMEQGNSERHFG